MVVVDTRMVNEWAGEWEHWGMWLQWIVVDLDSKQCREGTAQGEGIWKRGMRVGGRERDGRVSGRESLNEVWVAHRPLRLDLVE